MDISMDLGDACLALGEYEGALTSFQNALHMAWQLRQRARGADALVRIGKAESMAGRYDRATKHFEAALRLYEERDLRGGVADACLQMGKVYWLKGLHAEALQSYRKAERMYEGLSDEFGLGTVADAVASLHYDRGDLAQAERFYRRSIKLMNAIDDPRGVSTGLCNLGATWLSQGNTVRAINAWQEGMELASLMGDLTLQAMLGANLGEAYLKLDQLNEATDYFDKALACAEVGGGPRAMTGIRLNRAAILMKQKLWPEAVAELEMASELCDELDIPRLRGQLERMTGELFLAKHESGPDSGQGKHWNRAMTHLREGITFFVEAGCNLEAASTHERLAETLDAAGKRDEASREREVAGELRSAHYIATGTDAPRPVPSEDAGGLS
jgi:tetratricopeptide (TPR) repeat protein